MDGATCPEEDNEEVDEDEESSRGHTCPMNPRRESGGAPVVVQAIFDGKVIGSSIVPSVKSERFPSIISVPVRVIVDVGQLTGNGRRKPFLRADQGYCLSTLKIGGIGEAVTSHSSPAAAKTVHSAPNKGTAAKTLPVAPKKSRVKTRAGVATRDNRGRCHNFTTSRAGISFKRDKKGSYTPRRTEEDPAPPVVFREHTKVFKTTGSLKFPLNVKRSGEIQKKFQERLQQPLKTLRRATIAFRRQSSGVRGFAYPQGDNALAAVSINSSTSENSYSSNCPACRRDKSSAICDKRTGRSTSFRPQLSRFLRHRRREGLGSLVSRSSRSTTSQLLGLNRRRNKGWRGRTSPLSNTMDEQIRNSDNEPAGEGYEESRKEKQDSFTDIVSRSQLDRAGQGPSQSKGKASRSSKEEGSLRRDSPETGKNAKAKKVESQHSLSTTSSSRDESVHEEDSMFSNDNDPPSNASMNLKMAAVDEETVWSRLVQRAALLLRKTKKLMQKLPSPYPLEKNEHYKDNPYRLFPVMPDISRSGSSEAYYTPPTGSAVSIKQAGRTRRAKRRSNKPRSTTHRREHSPSLGTGDTTSPNPTSPHGSHMLPKAPGSKRIPPIIRGDIPSHKQATKVFPDSKTTSRNSRSVGSYTDREVRSDPSRKSGAGKAPSKDRMKILKDPVSTAIERDKPAFRPTVSNDGLFESMFFPEDTLRTIQDRTESTQLEEYPNGQETLEMSWNQRHNDFGIGLGGEVSETIRYTTKEYPLEQEILELSSQSWNISKSGAKASVIMETQIVAKTTSHQGDATKPNELEDLSYQEGPRSTLDGSEVPLSHSNKSEISENSESRREPKAPERNGFETISREIMHSSPSHISRGKVPLDIFQRELLERIQTMESKLKTLSKQQYSGKRFSRFGMKRRKKHEELSKRAESLSSKVDTQEEDECQASPGKEAKQTTSSDNSSSAVKRSETTAQEHATSNSEDSLPRGGGASEDDDSAKSYAKKQSSDESSSTSS